MKPLSMNLDDWYKLLDELHKDYPKSVLAIREKSKKVLGFTSRFHSIWINNSSYNKQMEEYNRRTKSPDYDLWGLLEPSKGYYSNFMQLDFYSEEKQTVFLIKYSEFIKCIDIPS